MTPENALHSYENTLVIARNNGDKQIEADLLYRIDLMKRFPKYDFDLNRLTCVNTHGDFFISQLICGVDRINAVIDWTTACVHPAVWEIMRSYVYAAPECAGAKLTLKSSRNISLTLLAPKHLSILLILLNNQLFLHNFITKAPKHIKRTSVLLLYKIQKNKKHPGKT